MGPIFAKNEQDDTWARDLGERNVCGDARERASARNGASLLECERELCSGKRFVSFPSRWSAR